MFQKNLTIAEIARMRGLVTSTIEGHLAFFVENGTLAIDRLIDFAGQRRIEEAMSLMPGNSLQ